MTLDSELRATVEALVGKPVPEWQWLIAEKLMTQTECDHPPDAIMWNPWNLVIQCHRCGHIIDALPPTAGAVMRCPKCGSLDVECSQGKTHIHVCYECGYQQEWASHAH
jgi:hypothetical protein